MAMLLITGDFKVSLCHPPRYLGLSVCQAVREQLKMIYFTDYPGQCVIVHATPRRDRSDIYATFQDQDSNIFSLLEGRVHLKLPHYDTVPCNSIPVKFFTFCNTTTVNINVFSIKTFYYEFCQCKSHV